MKTVAAPPPPKPLWQVLEEEYVALGGILSAEYEQLRDRIVKARPAGAARCAADTETLLKCLRACIHARAVQGHKRTALCFSGGGIRSATFNLGLLQALAGANLLDHFDFLSTVSGGGYIGSWFSAWVFRHPAGLDGVIAELQGAARAQPTRRVRKPAVVPPAPAPGETAPPAPPSQPAAAATGGAPQAQTNAQPAPGKSAARPAFPIADSEPAPVRHLRRYSRYLSPTLGLFSADTWTLVATYIRNLLVNWLVLVPLLCAGILLPRLCVAAVAIDPAWRGEPFLGISWQTLSPFVLACGAVAAVWGFAYAGLHQPSAQRARTARRIAAGRKYTPPSAADGQSGFLRWCLTPLLLAGACLATYGAWNSELPTSLWLGLLPFGATLGIIGWAVFASVEGDLRKLYELPFVIIGGLAAGLSLWGSAALLDWLAEKWQPWTLQPHVGLYYAVQVCLGVPLVLVSLSVGGTIYLGLISGLSSACDEDREWWARAGAWILIAALLSGLGGTVLFGPAVLFWLGRWIGVAAASAGGLTGLFAVVFSRFFSPRQDRAEVDPGWLAAAGRAGAALVGPLALVLLAAGISAIAGITVFTVWARLAPADDVSNYFPDLLKGSGTFWLAQYPDYFRMLYVPCPQTVLGCMLVLTAFALFMAWRIDLNEFSMHGMYRDRLIRAYLGASRTRRRPDAFTGLDPRDNLNMHWLRPETLRLADLDPDGKFLSRLIDAAKKAMAKTPTTASAPAPADEISDYLAAGLSADTRAHLAHTAVDDVGLSLRLGVLFDTNLILLENDLALLPQFAPCLAQLPAVLAAEHLSEDWVRQHRSLRNRLLLQIAYPHGLIPLGKGNHRNQEDHGDQGDQGDQEDQRARAARRRLTSAAPLHIINAAMNLVGRDDPAWQERKAENFTVSPLHCGSAGLGYRNSHRYAGIHGISLGTALTLSGAAVSPNMGSHSTGPTALLMTLFNVRLGGWLGNPGPAGHATFPYRAPRNNLTPLLAEALGRTDAHHPYVYLSDGGHFENLGLYEMVRRRCHLIVVGDAGCDPRCTYEDLGNAVRKIRIDMGIPISFTPERMPFLNRTAADTTAGRYCALAEIDYQARDGPGAVNGWLVYFKPSYYGAEPTDVLNYGKAHLDFAHESTADQFFSESQFESYRALGYHAFQEVWDVPPHGAGGFEQLLTQVRRYLNI